jgi:hypothetical protein
MVLVAAAGLFVAACGDSGGARPLTADEQAVATALDASIEAESAATDEPFTDADSRSCLAESIVRELGVARLAELGVTAGGVVDSPVLFERMTTAELETTADISVGCSDLVSIFVEEGGMSRGSAACFADRLTDEGTYADLILAGLKGESPADEIFVAMLAAGSDCLTSEEFADFFGTG